jgi:CRP/FNR family transcriptional regulator, cyclic AMP receptor protein
MSLRGPVRGTVGDMTAVAQGRISLLDIDPELARGVPGEDLPLVARHLVGRSLALEPGAIADDQLLEVVNGAFAAIVAEGALIREVMIGHDPAAYLFGPGDVLAVQGAPTVLLERATRWSAAGGARLAVVDDELLPVLRRWPTIGLCLARRAVEQMERHAVQLAIGQLDRVEDRVLATLWHLAERHGRVTPSGVHLPITLTHALLGRLVGARRPTVTLAVTTLVEREAIARRADRTWLIVAPPPKPATRVPGPTGSGALIDEPLPAVTIPASEQRPSTEDERATLLELVGLLRERQLASAAALESNRVRFAAAREQSRAIRRDARVTSQHAQDLRRERPRPDGAPSGSPPR